MLVLTLRPGGSTFIRIGDRVCVLKNLSSHKVQAGFDCPKDFSIERDDARTVNGVVVNREKKLEEFVAKRKKVHGA